MERRIITIALSAEGVEELSKLVGMIAEGLDVTFEGAPYFATEHAGEPDEVTFICLPIAVDAIPEGVE